MHSILSGSFAPLPGYTAVGGRGQMVRFLEEKTSVDMHLTGLTPNGGYVAHVHSQPCQYQGGTHYLIDPVGEDIETNGLWFNFTATAEGMAVVQKDFTHRTRGDALSLVVHDPAAGNAKMMCADLAVADTADVAMNGNLAPFGLAEAVDQTIAGSVTMTKSANSAHLELSLSGLDPAAIYGAHVHALPCAVNLAGGHYRRDLAIPADPAVETNEIWPAVTNYPAGSMTSQIDVTNHVLRADAQSVVVHRVVDAATKPKVACADLGRTYPGLSVDGSSTLLADGSSRLPSLTATASISRTLAGVTDVSIQVQGLTPETAYAAHVHNMPCSMESGGGHYMMDTTQTDAIETNEIWLSITADASGVGSDSHWVQGIARSDAQSIVIHDPADKARLACIDL